MKILVTGGTGFLGRHLVWRAAAAGVDVIFTGRDPRAAATVLQYGAARWLPLAHGSPDAIAQLTHAAQQADVVVHCAALSTPWGRTADFMRANVSSTEEVLAACHAARVPRLVHISTPSVYFDFQDRLNIREDSPLPPPVNEYARTKALAEARVCAQPLPETVILRPRALFGAWDQTLMPRLLRVMQRGALPVMRGGKIQLDLTYIDNAIDAIWLSMTQPLARPVSIYNVSNGEPQTLLPLLENMAQAFQLPLRTRAVPWRVVELLARGLETAARLGNGREPLLTRYSAGVLAFSQTLDIQAIRTELGYQPRVSIAEGILRHAAWWREQEQTT